MPIQENASPNELSSPFFVNNKRICAEFEDFIIKRNGEANGKYNAWSYLVSATIPHPKNWSFTIRKATYSSGNLLISAKSQNLHVSNKWIAAKFESDCPNFFIRRKTFTDFLQVNVFKNWSRIDQFNKYVIKSAQPEHQLIAKLKITLHELFKSGEVFSIIYQADELIIDLRTEINHTKIMDSLLQL